MKGIVIGELVLRLSEDFYIEESEMEEILSDKECLNRVNMNRPKLIEAIGQTLEKMENDYAIASFRNLKSNYEIYTKNKSLQRYAKRYINYIKENIQINKKR